MIDYLSNLNKEQYEAATTVEGPLLILAGAGSGKTNTMTHRIAYMIKDCGISPYAILAVTFTNKAANEMKERVERLVGNCKGMWIQTFHSACLRILRSNAELIGFSSSFVIYDPVDQKTVVKNIIKEMNLDEKEFAPALLLGIISDAKNKAVSVSKYREKASGFPKGVIYANVYARYQEVLKQNNAMDFDDLLINTARLFKQNPEVLAQYQARFQYIMVDEYQDTNAIQYHLVRMLAKAHQNICVVGDDDQCIYQWRGADIRNILDFEKDFPSTKVVKLEKNYRSTANIINAAHSVIVNNQSRKDKKMRTDAADGEKIEYFRADSDKEEAAWLCGKIDSLMRRGGLNYSDFAILYRNNAQSRRFEEALVQKGIPYQILSGMRYYDRAEIKDMIAYMRLVINPKDDVALLRIINTPRRGIGKKTVEGIQSLARMQGCSMFEAMGQMGVASELTELYRSIAVEKERMSVEDIYDTLVNRTGYLDALKSQNKVELESKIENILEFKTEIKEKEEEAAKNGEEFTIENFMEKITLASDVDNHDAAADSVSLMTMHSAKGLEFPIVFMPGMEMGLFPSFRSFDKIGGIDEERRLCYVGMTRAKEQLFLSSAEMRTMYGRTDFTTESQFLKEIDRKYLSGHAVYEKKLQTADRYSINKPYNDTGYVSPIAVIRQMKEKPKRETLAGVAVATGDRVEHPKFGEGTIVEVDGSILTVAFDEAGTKNMAKDMAPLKKI